MTPPPEIPDHYVCDCGTFGNHPMRVHAKHRQNLAQECDVCRKQFTAPKLPSNHSGIPRVIGHDGNLIHRVVLSTGRVLLVEESDESLHIGAEDAGVGFGAVASYVCQVHAYGVTVCPNSGDAVVHLTEGIKKALPDEGKKG